MKNTCCGNGKTDNMASMMDMMSSNGFNPMNMCKEMMQRCSNTTKETDSNQSKCSCSMSSKFQSDMNCC